MVSNSKLPLYLGDEDYEPSQVFMNHSDGSEFIASVRRAQPFWGEYFDYFGGEVDPIFIHVGFYFDNFSTSTSTSSKKGILSMRVLDMDRFVAFKYPELESSIISVFLDREQSEWTELKTIWERLVPEMEELARGFVFEKDGRRYQIFVVTSLIQGDLPALWEMMGLKRAVSTYPCIYCKVRYQRNNVACPYACSSDAFEPKLHANFAEAMSPNADGELREMMSILDGNAPLLYKFPGVQYPDSICADLMHLEFLGAAKKHIEVYHTNLAVFRGIPITRWEENFSKAYAKFGSQNGSSVQPDYRYQKVSGKPAFTILKQIPWNPFVLLESGDLGEVPLGIGNQLFNLRTRLNSLIAAKDVRYSDLPLIESLAKM